VSNSESNTVWPTDGKLRPIATSFYSQIEAGRGFSVAVEGRARYSEAGQADERKEKMDTWEYTIEDGIRTKEELVQFLNRMGAQGWEAVSVQWIPPNLLYGLMSRGYYEVSLKRRKQQG
jgi:hypothetical protein